MCVVQEEEEGIFQTTIYYLLTIETTLAMKKSIDKTSISNFIQNFYHVVVTIKGFDEHEHPK
jgi:hypothetical protein